MSNMPNSVKAPPVLEEGGNYENYKKEIKVWQLMKVCTNKEEGPVVFRTLTGRAKAAIIDLTVEEIGSETGLTKILNKLDALFLADKNQRIFSALDTFEKYRRSSNMPMSNFLLEFQKLHNQVTAYDCTYPDGVLAYRLLKAANISNDHEQLCRATIKTGEWSYKTITDQLQKIFNDVPTTHSSSVPAVKVEDVYHARNVSSPTSHPNLYDDREHCEDIYEDADIYMPNPRYLHRRDRAEYSRPSFDGPDDMYNEGKDFDIYYGSKFRRPFKPKFQQPRGFQRVPNQSSYYEGRNTGFKRGGGLKASYNNSTEAVNPKDSRGNHTTCRKCRSIYHWLQDCPHASAEDAVYYNTNLEDIYIEVMQSSLPHSSDQYTCLVGETLNHAVIDSGCAKTCCGKEWYEAYLESLEQEQISKIQCSDSKAKFRFGDSEPVASEKKVLLPMTIAERDILVETEVVPSDVPLLLSKEMMKRSKAALNFEKDTITLFGKEQTMICTSTGHYAIPISKNSLVDLKENPSENVILLSLNENSDVKSVAKKLHQQFSHPTTERLIKLIKTSGVENEELFREIEVIGSQCDTCKKYKKTRPRPAVTFPLATEFNETVALDLKVYLNNKIYFLHMIDHATRFSAASVITSKKKEVIVDEMFKHWVSIFGAPRKILSDNGGEFANSEFIDMCQNLNINFITTAAESPWSNGLVEKHNHIVGEAVSKIQEEVSCSVNVALCWAINAKNCLQNVYGFSPHQLVFSKNPNLPSVFEDKLPALEGVSGSKLVATHLNALHKAREEFIRLEASEKLRRALRTQTRTHNNTRYFNGDEVFYKRDDDNRWKGPARVIGQDGSKVLLKIPTGLITVHSCRVALTSESELNRRKAEEMKIDESTQNSEETSEPMPTIEITDEDDEEKILNTETVSDENREIIDVNEEVNSVVPVIDAATNTKELPRLYQCVQYKVPDAAEWKNVKIIGRAGKATGKHKFWLNIKDLDDDVESSVDWEQVTEWQPMLIEVFHSSLKDMKEDKFEEARDKELQNWKNLNVYDEVEDTGQRAISSRWVYTEKILNGERIKKARLVARGFEEQADEIQKDSPTCNKESLRVGIAIISSKEWELNSLDVKAAFLQGKELERDVYLKPPREVRIPGKLWRLRRCVYGLNDASRYWYFRIREELLKTGCRYSKLDPSVFIYHHDGELQGILISHVDDFLWSGTDNFKKKVINTLKSIFKISSENACTFKYIGIQLARFENGIYLYQDEYASELKEINVSNSRKVDRDSPLNDEERTSLRSLIGQLNWLSTQSRPDISYDVSTLGSSFKQATVKHILKANKVVKKVKMNNVRMFFPKLNLDELIVRCYADASYGKLEDGGSQGGMFIELVSNHKTAPIAWHSKRTTRVVKSTMAAETLAMVEALESAQMISELVGEILHEGRKKILIEGVTDSKQLYESSYSTKSVLDRRLRIDIAIIREAIVREQFVLNWVPATHQISDCLTKEGSDSSMLRQHISV